MTANGGSLRLGDPMPNFVCDSTEGRMSLHQALGQGWGILFSHPDDFTPVCTFELGTAEALNQEFKKRGVGMAGISCNDLESHRQWLEDIEKVTGYKPKFPIFCDSTREIAVTLGMLESGLADSKGMPLTARNVFVIGPAPERRIRTILIYPAAVGRSFSEILRAVDACQIAFASGSEPGVCTNVDWKAGDDLLLHPKLSDAAATLRFGKDRLRTVSVPSGKKYIRFCDVKDKGKSSDTHDHNDHERREVIVDQMRKAEASSAGDKEAASAAATTAKETSTTGTASTIPE